MDVVVVTHHFLVMGMLHFDLNEHSPEHEVRETLGSEVVQRILLRRFVRHHRGQLFEELRRCLRCKLGTRSFREIIINWTL